MQQKIVKSWFNNFINKSKSNKNNNNEVKIEHSKLYNRLPRLFRNLTFRTNQEYQYFREMLELAKKNGDDIFIESLKTTYFLLKVYSNHPVTFIDIHALFGVNFTTLILGHNNIYGDYTDPLLLECKEFKFPNTVRTLVIGNAFNLKLEIGMIPDSVTDLTILYGFAYEGFDWSKVMPRTLVSVTLPSYCRYSFKVGDLNHGLETLNLGVHHLQFHIVNGLFPSTLKYLKIGSGFDGVIDNDAFPMGLETLILHGFAKGCEIPQIPRSVKHVSYLNTNFARVSASLFSINLESLSMGELKSNLIEPNWLHNRLKKIELTHFNSAIVEGLFPDTVEELNIKSFNRQIEPHSLPKNLKILILSEFNHSILFGSFPEGLETLVMDSKFNQKIQKGHLPSTLKSLQLCGSLRDHQIELGSLPESLESLNINLYSYIENGLILPCKKLQSLEITGTNYKIPILENQLPKSLKVLKIPYLCYETLQSGVLEGLERIEVVYGIFLQTLLEYDFDPRCIPSTVHYLNTGARFNAVFLPDYQLPSALRTLVLVNQYSQQIPRNLLPTTLRKIFVPNTGILKDCIIPPFCSIINTRSLVI
ncbi:hypothetical protein DLAC_02051 [Tieghemostelium lacteum]|uniref:FNIP repeat-containing protein n=1 Tax=Tieghemostelium lacteum TaxID=361077 RepID=A0A152A514_TIELA|nr:hypothetical protein DLAC_02051 [Tieghemostelium lacteum]|eukprot:KYR01328.1 hypothetical protein DLAC_02051 [Tieghemostelium lacteum]